MKRLIIILITTLTILFTGCQKPQIDAVAEGEKLMQVSREWAQTVPTKDYEKILSYWQDDAVIISANQAPIRGKDAIRAMIEADKNNPAFSITWEPLEAHISEDGSMGYLIERNRVSVSDSLTLYHNAVTVWRKTADGSWKNVVDMSTPSAAW